MRAIVQNRYGAPEEVLQLAEIEKPEAGDGEVLVRVHAAAVAGDDWHLVRGLPYVARLSTGLSKPKTPATGRELAGVVEKVGGSVAQFKPGDEVFGWCDGAFAEYAAVSENALVLKPANLSFVQAAVVPVSSFTALQALRDEGGIQAGHKVLILGASGGVGTFAVQIAKSFDAEVTGVCSTSNIALVRSLGADHVVDYTREEIAQGYDVILDLVGNRSLSDLRRALSPKGTLVLVGSSGRAGRDLKGLDRWFMGVHVWIGALVTSMFVSQRLRPLVHADRKEDLLTLKDLIEAGKVTPVISAQYPLEKVPEAMLHFEAGHARGKVGITVEGSA